MQQAIAALDEQAKQANGSLSLDSHLKMAMVARRRGMNASGQSEADLATTPDVSQEREIHVEDQPALPEPVSPLHVPVPLNNVASPNMISKPVDRPSYRVGQSTLYDVGTPVMPSFVSSAVPQQGQNIRHGPILPEKITEAQASSAASGRVGKWVPSLPKIVRTVGGRILSAVEPIRGALGGESNRVSKQHEALSPSGLSPQVNSRGSEEQTSESFSDEDSR